jgi:hypothetical protein
MSHWGAIKRPIQFENTVQGAIARNLQLFTKPRTTRWRVKPWAKMEKTTTM